MDSTTPPTQPRADKAELCHSQLSFIQLCHCFSLCLSICVCLLLFFSHMHMYELQFTKDTESLH